jgi:hypothetical protein
MKDENPSPNSLEVAAENHSINFHRPYNLGLGKSYQVQLQHPLGGECVNFGIVFAPFHSLTASDIHSDTACTEGDTGCNPKTAGFHRQFHVGSTTALYTESV